MTRYAITSVHPEGPGFPEGVLGTELERQRMCQQTAPPWTSRAWHPLDETSGNNISGNSKFIILSQGKGASEGKGA